MEVKVKIVRNKLDLEAGFRIALKPLIWGKPKTNLLVFGLMMVSVISLLIVNKEKAFDMFNNIKIPIIILLGIWFLMWLTLAKIIAHFTFKKNPKICGPEELTFYDEGILVKGENFESKFDWQKYNRAVFTKRIILICSSTNVYYVYPKSCFTNRELDVVVSLIQKNIKDVKSE